MVDIRAVKKGVRMVRVSSRSVVEGTCKKCSRRLITAINVFGVKLLKKKAQKVGRCGQNHADGFPIEGFGGPKSQPADGHEDRYRPHVRCPPGF